MTMPAKLDVQAPFHLEATVRVLQRRPTHFVDLWQEGRYLRAVPGVESAAWLEVENRGTVDVPDVRYRVHGHLSATKRRSVVRTLRRLLGLDVNPALLAQLGELEPRLHPTVIALRGMRPPRYTNLFETLVNVLPFQQLSLESGLAIVGRLVRRFGGHFARAGRDFYEFPTAQSIAGARVDALRRCGLSARKAEALRFLARAAESGALNEDRIAAMSTDEALRALSDLPGIGPWSASLVLLRGLGRLDVVPPGDVGFLRGASRLLDESSSGSLVQVIERIGNVRGYLYFCSLGASLLAKGLIHAAPPRVETSAASPMST